MSASCWTWRLSRPDNVNSTFVHYTGPHAPAGRADRRSAASRTTSQRAVHDRQRHVKSSTPFQVAVPGDHTTLNTAASPTALTNPTAGDLDAPASPPRASASAAVNTTLLSTSQSSPAPVLDPGDRNQGLAGEFWDSRPISPTAIGALTTVSTEPAVATMLQTGTDLGPCRPLSSDVITSHAGHTEVGHGTAGSPGTSSLDMVDTLNLPPTTMDQASSLERLLVADPRNLSPLDAAWEDLHHGRICTIWRPCHPNLATRSGRNATHRRRCR